MAMKERGGTKQNLEGMPNVFQSAFSRSEMKYGSRIFALAKLRGLCKCLANVYKTHSHVYGLRCFILCTKSKAEKSMQSGESSFKELSVVSTQNMEKSPCNLNLLHCRQNHNLFMKRNERENKENAVRLIVHSITHRGERWRGGGM
jgi:hypothetical protein